MPRSYSRSTGASVWESVRRTRGHPARRCAARRRSSAGCLCAWSKHTATASTSGNALIVVSSHVASSVSVSVSNGAPSAPTRSGTPTTSARRTGGGAAVGCSACKLGRAWRASQGTSSNPALVRKSARPTLPSSKAFVPTVVPWRSSKRLSSETSSARNAASMAALGSSGREGTFTRRRVPSGQTRTASVKVPPVSIAIRGDAVSMARPYRCPDCEVAGLAAESGA